MDSTLPARLGNAPAIFRAGLKASKAGDMLFDLSELQACAAEEVAARRPCSIQEWYTCRVLVAEVAALGETRIPLGLHHVRTAAQAASFVARTKTWIRAREQLVHQQSASRASTLHHSKLGYFAFSSERYDFRRLVLRMLAEQPGVLDDLQANGDPLTNLHLGRVGRQEPGYLESFVREHEAGPSEFVNAPMSVIQYSKATDDATRYGCGSFNRAWKASTLRHEFLALYEQFIAEVIVPLVGCAPNGGQGLVYQAQPIFRAFLPHHLAVGPRHTDAEYHPMPSEINIWLPLTDAYESNSLQVESSPGAGDFEPITCGYGTLFSFRGNACEHFTEFNVSDATRVSLDFRVIRAEDSGAVPLASPDPHVRGKANYFAIGQYYNQLPHMPHVQSLQTSSVQRSSDLERKTVTAAVVQP